MKNNQSGKPTVFFEQLTERDFCFIAKSFHEIPLFVDDSALVGNGLHIMPWAHIILCIFLCEGLSGDRLNNRAEKVMGPPRAGFFVPQVAQYQATLYFTAACNWAGCVWGVWLI